MRKYALFILVVGVLAAGGGRLASREDGNREVIESLANEAGGGQESEAHPLSVEYLRTLEFKGSELVAEQELEAGVNYRRQIVSYKSEGLKQFALLTVPEGQPPEGGYPAIVFNHGYIPPNEYRTLGRYTAYVDGFARQGMAVLKPDYRGHGNSEGLAEGGYGSPAYTIDVLNALASLKKLPEVNPNRMGMWGHSMGGHITLRAMAVDPSIKAGVIWGGVVGSYADYQDLWWSRRNRPTPTTSLAPGQRGWWRQVLIGQFGDAGVNPQFWESISVTSHLDKLNGPVQLHHAKGDETVPYALSEKMKERMDLAGKEAELHLYEGDDHNLSGNFGTAMNRSVEFFKENLR